MIPAYATTADWRLICLDRQLPRPRFPAGISVPSIVCLLCVLLLSGLSLVYLAYPGGGTVPTALVGSQKKLVASIAHGLNAGSDRELDEIVDLAERYAHDKAHDPAKLVGTGAGEQRWRGIAVLAAATRKPLATRGDAVPPERVPPAASRPSRVAFVAPDGVRLLLTAPLFDGRTLVGVSRLVIRPLRLDPKSRQTIMIAAGTDLTHSQGWAVPPDDLATRHLARSAIHSAGSRRVASVVGRRDFRPPGHGSDTAPVVAAARVGNLDVFVVSAVHAPTNGTGWSTDGLVFAGVLLLLGLCVFLVIWVTLVRPLLRLLDHARAVACGGLGPHARLPRLAEMRRVARALDDSRASIHGRPVRRDGRYALVPAVLPVFVSALAIAIWSGVVMVTFSHRPVNLPSQLAADTHNQVEAAAASVRSVLEQGLAQLTRVARDNADRKPEEVRSALRRLTEDSSRYRSAYVAETSGRTVATAGREPLRHGGRVPDGDGVQLDTAVGRVPTIFVHARLSATHVLIAEFDIRYLTSVLRHVDGRVRLVDQDMRTVLDTEGFLAFQKLSAEAPRRAADDALKGHPGAEVAQVHGIRSLVASAPVAPAPVVPAPAAPAPAASAPAGNQPAGLDPHWAVVAERSLSEYQLPTNELRRSAWMVGFAGLCLALLLFGWLYFLVLLPLRALARAADRLAAGDLDTVIPPARQDELGAIAVCLDICRQAKAYGTERLAGAIRLRGPVHDQTLVLPCIPSPRQGARDRVDSTRRRR